MVFIPCVYVARACLTLNKLFSNIKRPIVVSIIIDAFKITVMCYMKLHHFHQKHITVHFQKRNNVKLFKNNLHRYSHGFTQGRFKSQKMLVCFSSASRHLKSFLVNP